VNGLEVVTDIIIISADAIILLVIVLAFIAVKTGMLEGSARVVPPKKRAPEPAEGSETTAPGQVPG
jgi:hypothetical protein